MAEMSDDDEREFQACQEAWEAWKEAVQLSGSRRSLEEARLCFEAGWAARSVSMLEKARGVLAALTGKSSPEAPAAPKEPR